MRSRSTLILPTFIALLLATPLARAGGPSPEADAFDAELDAIAPAAESVKGDKKGRLGSKKMRKANRVASELVQRQTRRDDLLMLRKAGSADVIVVTGTYDRVQDSLAAMEVDHAVIAPRHLAQLDLMATQTVMVNCPGNIPEQGIANLKSFVRRGGHLVTTDWALKNLTQRAFPDMIRWNKVQTKDDVVSVQVHEHSHPLVSDLRMNGNNPRWWLEGSSYPIRVLDKDKVKVLISSKEMRKRYGQGPVAVSFRHHDGEVLHMTSHFYLQRSKNVKSSEKKDAKTLAKDAGLSDKDLEELARDGGDLDGVEAGDVTSAYAMQKLWTNVLVEKQKANKKLLKKYEKRLRRDIDDDKAGAGKGKGKRATRTSMRKGFRVKVVDRKKDKVKVEDLFGNQAWVPADALQ